ncbi:MAG: DUF6677 family protein [Phycisphaerales bacterium]
MAQTTEDRPPRPGPDPEAPQGPERPDPAAHAAPYPTPLAAFLAWILPGLGYVWRGQVARGGAVGGSIIALILAGLLIGGPDAIDSREERWWFLVQAGGGPIVLALDQWHQRILKVPAQEGAARRIAPHPDPAMNPGNQPPSFTRSVARVNESARLYIVIAGMLNIIAVIDCMAMSAPAHRRRQRSRS